MTKLKNKKGPVCNRTQKIHVLIFLGKSKRPFPVYLIYYYFLIRIVHKIYRNYYEIGKKFFTLFRIVYCTPDQDLGFGTSTLIALSL